MEQSTSTFPERYFGTKQPERLPTKEAIAAMPRHKRHLVAFITELPEHARLLDVGCGSGKAIKLVRTLRPDVTIDGMDITDMGEFLPAGVSFKQGSVDELDRLYAPESFDAIICQHVIEHLVSPLSMITGMRTILKSEGKLYLETPNWSRLFVPFSHLYFWNDYTHIHPYGPTTMYRMFFDHHMKVKVHTVSSSVWFPKRSATHEAGGRQLYLNYDGRGILSRVFARLVNPFLRDTLIAIATK